MRNLLSSLRGFKRSRLSDCEGMGGGVVARSSRFRWIGFEEGNRRTNDGLRANRSNRVLSGLFCVSSDAINIPPSDAFFITLPVYFGLNSRFKKADGYAGNRRDTFRENKQQSDGNVITIIFSILYILKYHATLFDQPIILPLQIFLQ